LAALLVDSPEPLWRSCPEPELKTITSEEHGDMQHWVVADRSYLEIAESSTGLVQRFVRSPGGTRTLVFLDPQVLASPGPHELTLILQQREHHLAAGPLAVREEVLFSSPLPPEPPWRLNDV
jgi:hypothetical protein